MDDRSVDTGDIDENIKVDTIRRIIRDRYIRDATVTIVLVGKETWKRKHVDWEIGASIRDTKLNPRTGLLGVILPTHPNYNTGSYNKCIIPPRLHDNIECGFAKLYNWTEDASKMQEWIHEAFLRRKKIKPNNSYPHYARNRAENQTSWC